MRFAGLGLAELRDRWHESHKDEIAELIHYRVVHRWNKTNVDTVRGERATELAELFWESFGLNEMFGGATKSYELRAAETIAFAYGHGLNYLISLWEEADCSWDFVFTHGMYNSYEEPGGLGDMLRMHAVNSLQHQRVEDGHRNTTIMDDGSAQSPLLFPLLQPIHQPSVVAGQLLILGACSIRQALRFFHHIL